tara:strand:- start:267 stop:458 length:192 start_codon:yes stop_codon:yes gene_type:complete
MTVKEYLQKIEMSTPKFAKQCGINLATMNSYRYNKSVPKRKHMETIYKNTNKQVKPNDFYGLY